MSLDAPLLWYFYPALIGAGFLAGFINTLAGSGSLITLPLLIFLGLPANVANGTNRVAILLQNIVGVRTFRQKAMLDTAAAIRLGIPAVLGSILGAQIAVGLDEQLLRRTIGALMLVMLLVLFVRPERWLEGRLDTMDGGPSPAQFLLFFAIGVYGGFIQAGVGILLLAGLVLSVGYNVVRANAVKVGIVLLFTLAALAVFLLNGQVVLIVGLILGIGNMLGAWFAVRFASERGAIWVRRLLIAVVTLSALQLLGVFSLVAGLL